MAEPCCPLSQASVLQALALGSLKQKPAASLLRKGSAPGHSPCALSFFLSVSLWGEVTLGYLGGLVQSQGSMWVVGGTGDRV